jgi:hypothetical protein
MTQHIDMGPTRFKCTGEPTHCALCAIDALTDDQLRAECNRRWGEDDCPMAKTLRHERDEADKRAQDWAASFTAMRELRDEWKRRADAEREKWQGALLEQQGRARAAEERVASLESRIEGGYLPTIARHMRLNESGPGIAAAAPDNSVAHLDEDLLADDA